MAFVLPSSKAVRITISVTVFLLVLQCGGAVLKSKPWRTGDTGAYLRLANGLVRGEYGNLINGVQYPEAVRPPGYPMFVYLLLYVFHSSPLALILSQEVLWLGAIGLVAVLAARYDRTVALVFVLLCAIDPFGAAYSSLIMTEALSVFLVALAVFAIIYPQRPSVGWAALAGCACALATLTRPNLVLLPLVLLAALWWHNQSRPVLASSVLLASFAIVLLPYSIYNHRHFGTYKPLPPAGAVGNLLFNASWEADLSPADFDALSRHIQTPAAVNSGFIAALAEVNKKLGADPSTSSINPESYEYPAIEIAASRVYRDAALEKIHREPGKYLHHLIIGVWRFWVPTYGIRNLPRWLRIALIGEATLMWVLAVLGCAYAIRLSDAALVRTSLLLVGYFTAVHVWLATQARYTIPGRPFLILIAALALCRIRPSKIAASPNPQ
jgi:4-amino-4-deoxy-L-arabinose transferase-like glycosyltransferase